MQERTRFPLQVTAALPASLARLADIAGDLWYAWNRPARELFSRLHPELWEASGHNPKAFLRQVAQQTLLDAAASPAYEQAYRRVLASYDAYLADTRPRIAEFAEPEAPVAYFCAEFGFHESLPIYSGGLGILAGDHCKAASDLRLPLVGVGLLYRQGYFNQTLDAQGGQVVAYTDADFADLPIQPVVGADGAALQVPIDLAGRRVRARAWLVRAGHARLYLLDTDVAENSAADRGITRRLYGGDRTLRLEQEMVLGIGGVRLLGALGIRPGAWHINEGHAALLILERACGFARQGGLDLKTALEAAGANTLFTTHTPVPAGHDQFPAEMIAAHLGGICGAAGIDVAEVLALGRMNHQPDLAAAPADFNLTAFGMRGARFHNGVSRLHGAVTAKLLQPIWPQVPHEDNPVGYVTNGIHAPSFLASEWSEGFERHLGLGWREQLELPGGAAQVDAIPDELFWSIHQRLKARMLRLVQRRVLARHLALGGSEAHAKRMLRHANPDDPSVLTIGFSRRFATYKRANLLLRDLDWLRRIACAEGRPVLFLFAGKAHPADEPGQRLIREIAQAARMLEFEDKLLLIEGYDISVARRLVTGVDVWLNTPIHTTEASGTSGMKAGINGVLNLSVLDGWWDEGYQGSDSGPANGWAIRPTAAARPQEERDAEEARAIYELLQDEVAPLYYRRDAAAWSRGWVAMAKRSMASLLPRFNASRMVNEYARRYYRPARAQGERRTREGFAEASALAAWKSRVHAAWPGVSLRRLDAPVAEAAFGAKLRIEVELRLAGLAPADVAVELLLEATGGASSANSFPLAAEGAPEHDLQRYALELDPALCGRLSYSIRAYPRHELLTHRFELGLMRWL